MAKVGPEIEKFFPILADWDSSPYRWDRFQFLESQAIIETVHTLATAHGIPALPVHDSIVVPVSKTELAKTVLSDAFATCVGITPELKITT